MSAENMRLVIKTDAGPFIVTPTMQIATASEKGIRYEFPHDIKPDTKIFIRKTSAEGLTLKDHIIPTLWARSAQYQMDRNAVFEGYGAELPTTTRLGTLLKNMAQRQGKSEKEAIVLVRQTMPSQYNYSTAAIRNWFNNEVMFPARPDALLSVAKILNDPNLEKWTSEMINSNQLPVKRLRTLHQGIRAILAKPKGKGGTNSNNGQENGDHEKILSLSTFLPLLRAEYGEHVFEEFVSTVNVKEVSSFKINTLGPKNGQHNGDSQIVKDVVGFQNQDLERKTRTLKMYYGIDRAAEIEKALKVRREMILTRGMEGMVAFRRIILKELEPYRAIDDYKFSVMPYFQKDSDQPGRCIAELFLPYIGGSKENVLMLTNEESSFAKLMLTQLKTRKETFNLMTGPIDRLLNIGKSIPLLSHQIKIAEEIHNSSPIERATISTSEIMAYFSTGIGREFQKMCSFLSQDVPTLSKGAIDRIFDINRLVSTKFWDTLSETKLDKLKEDVDELDSNARIPTPLKFFQTAIKGSKTESLFMAYKLIKAYGISDVYPYQTQFIQELNLRSAAMLLKYEYNLK